MNCTGFGRMATPIVGFGAMPAGGGKITANANDPIDFTQRFDDADIGWSRSSQWFRTCSNYFVPRGRKSAAGNEQDYRRIDIRFGGIRRGRERGRL
jgi:hypothetical protein